MADFVYLNATLEESMPCAQTFEVRAIVYDCIVRLLSESPPTKQSTKLIQRAKAMGEASAAYANLERVRND